MLDSKLEFPERKLIDVGALLDALPQEGLTSEHEAIVERAIYYNALNDFWHYRCLMRPQMLDSWWQRDVAAHLMEFYFDFIYGKRPKLILMAPPQHGKSEQVRDFVSWMMGRAPQLKTIFASYSNELGVTTNLHLQRLFLNPKFRQLFPQARVARGSAMADMSDEERVRRTMGVIEFARHGGSFRNTTVDGQITGFGLDVGVIDDPIKGRAEAQSKATRDRAWGWFVDDFFSRFAKDAGMIMIMTRWHVDDPAGRWLERWPETKVVRYAAIAEPGDWSVRAGHRAEGEALFPAHKPLDFLLERRRMSAQASWESLYQQHPIVVGGGIFPIERLHVLPIAADPTQIARSVRYVDKGGTQGGGAYTAMVLMHRMRDGRHVIDHVARGQWGALEREEKLKFWAHHDKSRLRPGAYEVAVEQEPGSGGKESAEATIRNLAGLKVVADKVTGSKEIRAEPFAAQVQGGNVWLTAGQWHADLLDEMESFPSGRYRDQCDACSGAFNRLNAAPVYDLFGAVGR